MPDAFTVPSATAELSGEESGEGPAVVLAHGLTATRRYVVHGSRSLERGGHRVISYDARGHGESTGGAEAYSYERLVDDLIAIMDARGVQRAVLAGVSMGAHTLAGVALAHPERVAGLVIITPAYAGQLGDMSRWERLAAGLRAGGVEGFVAATDFASVAPELRDTVETVIRQRMSRHRDLEELARALDQVPRSAPFGGLGDLAAISTPTVVIGSNDRADPEHPLRVAQAWAEAIPGARLLTEEPGRSPMAWQGSQVSRVIAELAQG